MPAGVNSPVFDYTSLDYASVRADLVSFAQTTFPSEVWTDFNESNFGTYLLDLVAYATDLLAYNANAQVLETLPLTAVREQNFMNIVKNYDYVLRSATPAQGEIQVTVSAGTAFTLSKHLQFATSNQSVIFQPLADTPIGTSAGTYTVSVIAGKETYQESLGLATGAPSESYTLTTTGVLDNTLSITVGAVTFSEAKHLVDYGPPDQVYTTIRNDLGYTTITFGDGQNGILLSTGAQILATYKTGGGLASTVAPGAITTVHGDATGAAIPTRITAVTNATATSGGGPATTLAQARVEFPLSLKTNNRAVTASDYATFAAQVYGVQKATALAGALTSGTIPIVVLAVPNGATVTDPPAAVTDTLRTSIVAGLTPYKMLGKRIQVLNPVYTRLVIDLDVIANNTYSAATLYQYAVTTLTNKYDTALMPFGAFIGLQDAYNTFDPATSAGVRRVLYRKFTIQPYGSAYLNRTPSGDGSVSWIDVNWETVDRREWNITFTSATTFNVHERWVGQASMVTASVVSDDNATYGTDEFSALNTFVLRPATANGTSYPVVGNTTQTISVTGNIGGDLSPGDPYVVERIAYTTGKILQTTLSAAATATTTVTVTSSAGFTAGDYVVIRDSLTNPAYVLATRVVSVPSGTQLQLADSVTAAAGVYVDYRWVSPDGSTTFVVKAGSGSYPFLLGDQLYVDTYPAAQDIQLRPENFPVLYNANINVRVIGGVR